MTSTRLRFGLAGLGRIVQEGHLSAYRANNDIIEVVAACDPDPRWRELVGSQLHLPTSERYTNLFDLLTSVDVDAVVIASPPYSHHDAVVSTLEHGVAALCEKPLCLTSGELTSICNSLCQTGGFLSLLHNYLYKPGWQYLIGLVRAGRIGTPIMTRFEELSSDHWREANDTTASWRQIIGRGGGPLRDNLYHAVYLAEQLLGSPVCHAVGIQAALVHPYQSGDTAAASIRHENGSVTQAMGTWCYRGTERAQVEVLGTTGTLRYAYWHQPARIDLDDGKNVASMAIPQWTPSTESGYVAAFREVTAKLRQGEGPPHGIETATRILSVTELLGTTVTRRHTEGGS